MQMRETKRTFEGHPASTRQPTMLALLATVTLAGLAAPLEGPAARQQRQHASRRQAPSAASPRGGLVSNGRWELVFQSVAGRAGDRGWDPAVGLLAISSYKGGICACAHRCWANDKCDGFYFATQGCVHPGVAVCNAPRQHLAFEKESPPHAHQRRSSLIGAWRAHRRQVNPIRSQPASNNGFARTHAKDAIRLHSHVLIAATQSQCIDRYVMCCFLRNVVDIYMRRGACRGICFELQGLTSSLDVTSRHQDEPLFSDSWSFRLNPVAGQVRAFWRLARLGVSASGCSSESTHTNVRSGARALQSPPPMSRGCGSARDRVGELHVHVCRH